MKVLPRNEREPHQFSRRILLATIGLNPQILTETIYALAVQAEQPFVPNEIYVITTAKGRQPLEDALLSPAGNMLQYLADDYDLDGVASALTVHRIHVIKDLLNEPLSDIHTEKDNFSAANLITTLVRRLTQDDDAALHVSLAGGRKTMTFLMGYALTLFGRSQDRLSHMLVDQDYELHPSFFYPPRVPKLLTTRDGRKVSTAHADLRLAEIPFVPLRKGMPEELLSGEATYAETVERARAGITEAQLIIDHKNKQISCHGEIIKLSPLKFAIYAWLARRRQQGLGGDGDGSIHWWETGDIEIKELLNEYRQIPGLAEGALQEQTKRLEGQLPKETMEENKSRINRDIQKQLGYMASHYQIKKMGRVPNTVYNRIGLEIDASSIKFDTIE